jgi:adenosine deaminase
MTTKLILAIDRRNTASEADEVVDLALKYRAQGVVGVDLCGDPTVGDVSIFRAAFARAKAAGLGITLHFAEAPQSSTDDELRTLLEFEPDRIGHAIHVSEQWKKVIRERRIGLELCLSCNVNAKLIMGGFADHHFGEWWAGSQGKGCPIILCVSSASPLRASMMLTRTCAYT